VPTNSKTDFFVVNCNLISITTKKS